MSGFFARGSSNTMRTMLLLLAFSCSAPAELSAQWVATGSPMGGNVVALAADSRYFYLGTSQGHLWRRPLSELVTGVQMPERLADTAPEAVLAAYPNPCNASTVFTFSLRRPSNATLLFFDMLGRKVLTIIDRPLEAGFYRVPAEFRSLSSGTYVAVLRAGDLRLASRLVLVR